MILHSILLLVVMGVVSPEVRRDYEAALIRTSSDAEAQVRLALWCESHGLDAERKSHLEQALRVDPTHAKAQGLLGLIDDGVRLARPQEISRRAQQDTKLIGLLTQYEARRDAAQHTVGDQWKLALWCESVGLKAQATGHFAAVTRLDPEHSRAWSKLGCSRYQGRWLTPRQIAGEEADALAQRKADTTWSTKLATLKRKLAEDETRLEAAQKLALVHDPRAVPSIVRTFVTTASSDQSQAVTMLTDIESPESARALAGLAVMGRSKRVRQSATTALLRHDPAHYVDELISRFRDPIKYASTNVEGVSSPGILLVDRPDVIERRVYEPPTVKQEGMTAVAGPNQRIVRGSNKVAVTEEVRRSIAATETQLNDDIGKINDRNAAIGVRNVEVARVLQQVSGRQFGPSRIEWTQWWVDQKGESYKSTSYVSPKPVVENRVAIAYAPPVVAQPFTVINLNMPTRSSHNCFAAGTPVVTLKGLQTIETIAVGDLVLTQNVTSGAMGYEPVVAALKNPPSPTLRLEIEGESIVTTGIHRFWTPGHGWTMARDLKVGDRIRTLDGPTPILAITAQPVVRPVFNLEVAEGANFFVGRHAVLVHDHSTALPVAHPFDAVVE